jgi:hypothetical protein
VPGFGPGQEQLGAGGVRQVEAKQVVDGQALRGQELPRQLVALLGEDLPQLSDLAQLGAHDDLQLLRRRQVLSGGLGQARQREHGSLPGFEEGVREFERFHRVNRVELFDGGRSKFTKRLTLLGNQS